MGKFKVNRLESRRAWFEGPVHAHAADGEAAVFAVFGGSGTWRSTEKRSPCDLGHSVPLAGCPSAFSCVPVLTGSLWIGIGATGDRAVVCSTEPSRPLRVRQWSARGGRDHRQRQDRRDRRASARRRGHEVAIANSRGPESLGELVAELGERARAADRGRGRRAGELVLVAIPLHAIDQLPANAFAGKVVIDANNYYAGRDGAIAELDDDRTTSSELLAARLPGARVVKAFNTLNFETLAGEARPHAPLDQRLAIPLAGDDADAKQRVAELIEQLGFAALDTGSLAEGGRLQQPGAPFFNRPVPLPEARQEFWQLANRRPDAAISSAPVERRHQTRTGAAGRRRFGSGRPSSVLVAELEARGIEVRSPAPPELPLPAPAAAVDDLLKSSSPTLEPYVLAVAASTGTAARYSSALRSGRCIPRRRAVP